MKTLLALLLALGQAQQPTPAQLIDQLQAVVKQLQQLFPSPTNPVPPAPTVVTVNSATELDTALKAKAPRVFLNPGTYLGNWTLAAPVFLEGTRDAVLTPSDPLNPTFTVTASDVTVVGVKISCGTRDCIVVGDLAAKDASTQPARVSFENNTVEAGAKGGHRGFALHGTALTVRNNRITGFWEVGRDSQGVWGNNGAGPYTVIDNYIEASGENILFGGSDPGIVGMVPSDILVRGNTLVKPLSYKTLGATVKNSLEFKNARRVLATENVIDGWWPAGQGAPIQFTPRNQDGTCNWCVVEDIAFIANTVRNAPLGFAINILGTDNEHPSAQTKRITIARNLFTDSQGGIQVIGGVEGGMIVDHNTFPGIKTKLFSFDRIANTPDVLTALTFTNNVFRAGTYGVSGDGSTAMGLPSLMAFCSLTDWSGNVIGGGAYSWPAGQVVVSNTSFTALLDPVTFKLLSGTAGY